MLAGINSLWLLAPLPGTLTTQTLPLAVVMATLGVLLPDLDAVESKIKNLGAGGITPFAPVAQIVNRSFGHRGLLHSPIMLLPVAILSAVLSFWIGVVPGISLLLGYGSHLVMDAMTRSGISLQPMSQKRLHLLPSYLRIVTGSLQEDMLMLCLALIVLPLLLHFFPFA
jgi:inner membrane protein